MPHARRILRGGAFYLNISCADSLRFATLALKNIFSRRSSCFCSGEKGTPDQWRRCMGRKGLDSDCLSVCRSVNMTVIFLLGHFSRTELIHRNIRLCRQHAGTQTGNGNHANQAAVRESPSHARLCANRAMSPLNCVAKDWKFQGAQRDKNQLGNYA